MGIRAGFSFGERQIFVGNRLAARPLDYSGAGGGGKVPCRITRCCEEQRCVLAWQFSSSVSRYRRLHGPSLTTPEFRDIYKEDIASGRVGRCDQRRTAMNGYPPRKPQSARRVAFRKWAFVGAIAGASLISACSQPSDSQQTAEQQQPADEQARKDGDERAWADAEKAGTVAAYTAYLQNFGAGAHVSEASQRIVALNEQARKTADEKAWADAEKAGTAAAYTAYIQNFGGGAHAAEARQRVSELSRKEADERAWADAVRTGTAAAFTAYSQNFSTGAHVAEARQRLAALDEQARKDADDKAWADAEKAGTATALTGYVQKFGSGAHVAEARQRLAALDEQARKEADEKAWADAQKAGTAGAFTGYVQKFGSGAHVAEARQRVAALETQGRREVPSIDIQKTCQAAAGAMVSLMGGTTNEQDVNACLDSEQKARDQIVKDRATYASADKKQCMRTDAYLPSYVEWLTCLEMERDVRKMRGEDQSFGPGPYTLPKVSPTINPAATRQSQRGREPASSRRKGSRLEIY